MTSVTSPALVIALAQAGALGVLHRHCSVEEHVTAVKCVKNCPVERTTPHAPLTDARGRYACAAAIGADDIARARTLEECGVDIVFLDCAQPYHSKIMRMFQRLRTTLTIPIVVGNVATREAAMEYCNLGASALRVGLGPGSACTTSCLTGIGVPQLSAIIETARETRRFNVPVIADGGISNAGDIMKALAAGADAVMLGRLLAGSLEAQSELIMQNGKRFKKYQASRYDSVELQHPTRWEAVDRYIQEEGLDNFRVEGIGGLIPYTGPAHLTIIQLERALRLGFGFTGSQNIQTLRNNAQFVLASRINGANGKDTTIEITEKSFHF